MLTLHSLTLEEWSKVKSDITKRFATNDFLKVDSALQTSRTNNKRDCGTFMLTRPSLTFAADDFIKVDCTLQTSRMK